MKAAFVLLFLAYSTNLFCQDITGIWRGTFSRTNKVYGFFNQKEEYRFEVQLSQEGKQLIGVTYSYLDRRFYAKASAQGTINTINGKVLLQELKLIELKTSLDGPTCVMTCFLQYSKEDDEEVLKGTYFSMNMDDSSNCGNGVVELRKVLTSDFKKEPFLEKPEKKIPPIIKTPPPVKVAPKQPVPVKKKPVLPTAKPPVIKQPAKPPAGIAKPALPKVQEKEPIKKPAPTSIPSVTAIPKVLTSRENALIKTIVVHTNEVTINIYDNGAIDHDTVSVYLDKELVVSKKMLTTTPITVKLKLDDKNNYHEVVMVAENLGDIPPNTSLMVVQAGTERYEVRITSTEQKNAVVGFKYEP